MKVSCQQPKTVNGMLKDCDGGDSAGVGTRLSRRGWEVHFMVSRKHPATPVPLKEFTEVGPPWCPESGRPVRGPFPVGQHYGHPSLVFHDSLRDVVGRSLKRGDRDTGEKRTFPGGRTPSSYLPGPGLTTVPEEAHGPESTDGVSGSSWDPTQRRAQVTTRDTTLHSPVGRGTPYLEEGPYPMGPGRSVGTPTFGG